MCYSNCPYEIKHRHPQDNGGCKYGKGDPTKDVKAHCYEDVGNAKQEEE